VSEATERIALLEKVLREQWSIYIDCLVHNTDRKLRERAFLAFDRRLRKIGVLPKV
jgi:hypothetical protein